jgi:hypothetical protein
MTAPLRILHVSLAFLCAGELVLIGLLTANSGQADLSETPVRTSPAPNLWLHLVTRWDGQWYVKIVGEGYEYQPESASSVAFLPAYPLLGRVVASITGWSAHGAAWAVGLTCLVSSFGIFSLYLTGRRGFQTFDSSLPIVETVPRRTDLLAIAALALYPPCFFMWMAYSESLFLLLCLVAMLGIQGGWRPVWIALVMGAATGTRVVGVALLAPLALYVWRRERGCHDSSAKCGVRNREWSAVSAALRLAALLPVACWGLLAYMAFQWHEFGMPFAFTQTQEHWSMRPPVDWATKALILASGEPIWAAYVPGSAAHWTGLEERMHPLLSLHFFEPLYFVAAVMTVCVGAQKRWLNGYEVLLAAGLLFIPYVTKGYEMTMASQARFTTVVFPIYIVLGEMVVRVPWWAAVAFFAACGTYLAIYSAMWAGGHVLI